MLGGELIFPLDRAKETLRFYRDWSIAAPDKVRADATMLSGLEGPALAIIVCYCGSTETGEKVLQPLRQFGPPFADTVAPSPYARIQNSLTEVLAPGFLHYWKSGFSARSERDRATRRLLRRRGPFAVGRGRHRTRGRGGRSSRRGRDGFQPPARAAQLSRPTGMARARRRRETTSPGRARATA